MMTPEEKQLVRETFALVRPIADQAAAIFYTRLFELAPHTYSMFPENMDAQGKKLMQAIGVAVAHLDKLDEVVPMIQQLGKRHAGYGVHADDYHTVGQALLWTLEQGLGEVFTAEARVAWKKVYTLLANTMLEAANQSAAEVAI